MKAYIITAKIKFNTKKAPKIITKQPYIAANTGISASIKLYMIRLHPSVVIVWNTVSKAFPKLSYVEIP